LDDSPQFSFNIRPIWRLAAYVGLVWVLWTVKNLILELLLSASSGSLFPLILLLEEVLAFAVVYGAALILARIEQQPLHIYGLPFKQAFGRRFWEGCIFGLCEISAVIGLIAAFHGYSFGTFALHGPEALRWALEWAAIFVVVGLFEEFAYRGYSLYTLAQGVGFWPAAFLLAVYFGYEHSLNPGESLAGEAGIVAVALLFALTVRRTGTLWLAIGWHATFDFGETFLYSVPDSGQTFPGHLSNATLHGADWLTGGATGPEGSVFSFIVMGALAVMVHYRYPAESASPSEVTSSAVTSSAIKPGSQEETATGGSETLEDPHNSIQ
jgi:CAAX protease family protein